MKQPALLKKAIANRAAELGFDTCRFVSPGAIPAAADRLDAWLASGAHGAMDWMRDTAARRSDPRTLWPDVRSIIMLGANYGPDGDPLETLDQKSKATISVYARNRDYHAVLKGRLKTLAQWIQSGRARQISGNPDGRKPAVKVFIDTAPVMEKPLAEASGLGWQGKHTNLVSREFGSWLFLASIYTTWEIPPDDAATDACGSCRACLDICPTDAFPAPYKLDARRCISYLTIEHQDHIDLEFRKAMGNRIYGCDDCLAVCPWNKFAQQAKDAKLAARDDLRAPDLAGLLQLNEDQFRRMFSASPIKRIGHAQFIRNVLIAAGNSGDAALLPLIAVKLGHESAIVRAAAVWAAAQLQSPDTLRAIAKKHLPFETDSYVRAEWQAALSQAAME